MDIFRVTALINLGILIVFFGALVVSRIRKRHALVGSKKIGNKFMFAMTIVSSTSLLILWLSYILDITIITAFLCFPPLTRCIAIKWTAVFLISFATVIEIVSAVTLGGAFRIHTPEEKADIRLVRHGLYGVVRNPIVLGVFCYAFGVMLLSPGLPGVVMFLAVFVSYNYKVDTEARELEKRFAVEWRDYCRMTGKYVPVIRRRAGGNNEKNK